MTGRVLIFWGPSIEGLGGEVKLLGWLLHALDELDVPYKVFVPRVVRISHIIEENITRRLGTIVGFSRDYINNRPLPCASLRVLLSALREVRRDDILLIRGPGLIETFFSYLYKMPRNFKLIAYTGIYGSHVFDLEAINAYGLAFPNYAKRIRSLKRIIPGAPIYLVNTTLSRLLKHLVVLSAFSEPLLMVFKKGKRNVALLYPVVDTKFFSFKRLISYNDPVLSVVARISPEKNIHLAIILANKLSKLFKDLKLIICGNINNKVYYNYLIKIASKSKTQIRIITNCSWREARTVYWSSNVLLNFSEGAFGIVNIEALASGCVPVAHLEFSNAVLPYGVIFRTPREALRRTAKLLLNTEELRWRSIKGSEYVRKNFSQEAFIWNLKKILEYAAAM